MKEIFLDYLAHRHQEGCLDAEKYNEGLEWVEEGHTEEVILGMWATLQLRFGDSRLKLLGLIDFPGFKQEEI